MNIRQEDHLGTMAFLGRLQKHGMKAIEAPVFSAFGGQGYGTNGGLYGSSPFAPWQPGAKRDYRADAGDLWRNSAVANCLAWYGDNFPVPRMRVMRMGRDGEETPVPNHPLIRLLQRPNPYYGWHDLAKGLALSYRCDGNAYLYVSRPLGHMMGEPVNLWWIDHNRIWPRWDSSGDQYLGWWDYQVDGRIIRLQPDQVIHFRDGVDPHNDRLGLCALKSNLREVCTDNEGSTYTAAIMRNLGVVGYAISPASEKDNFGDKEDRDEIADSFVEAQGGERRGRPLVASLGMKIDRLGLSPEEMALDVIMKIPESRICSAMRLPAMVVGLAVGAEQRTFANYEEARKAAYEDGLIPMQMAFAAKINQDVMPLVADPQTDRFEFDYDNIPFMRENQDSKFTRYGMAYQRDKVLTLNMALKGLGYAPVAGGDRYADGSTPEEGPQVPKPPVMATPADGDQDPLDEKNEAEAAKALIARVEAVLARAEEITVETTGGPR
jgi:HK97 family phage portal protein